MICSHSSTQVAWAFAKRLGTGAAGVPITNEPDDIACAEASRKMFEAWSEECILRFPDGDFKAQELANAVWAVCHRSWCLPTWRVDDASTASSVRRAGRDGRL